MGLCSGHKYTVNDMAFMFQVMQISKAVIHLGLRLWWVTFPSICIILNIIRKANLKIVKLQPAKFGIYLLVIFFFNVALANRWSLSKDGVQAARLLILFKIHSLLPQQFILAAGVLPFAAG